MKKFTALAGVLLLSSSVLVACTPNAAPDNNRAGTGKGTYNTAGKSGRVTDLGNTNYTNRAGDRFGVRNVAPNRSVGGDQDRLGVRDNWGPGRANVRDQDRLGVRDNWGPDRLGGRTGAGAGILGNAAGNTTGDQDRLGVRDNWGPDRRGANMREDRTLESRVETIPGIRDARVFVAGNTAYVAINQGTGGTTGGAGTMGLGNTGDTRTGTLNGNDGSYGRAGMGTMGARTGGATTSLNGTGTNGFDGVTQYGGTMSDRDVTLRNNAGGRVGAGTYATPGTPGTAGTYGTAGTNGTAGTPGTGYYGYNAGANKNATTYYSNGGTGNGVGTSQYGTAGIVGGAGRYATRGTVNQAPQQSGQYNTAGNARTNNATGTTRGYSVYADNSVSTDVKNQVARIVRQHDATISTVYVSANPNLMNRMNAYGRNAGAGLQRGGNDLMDAVRRMFPAAR